MELMEEMWRQADEENEDDETLLITSSDDEENEKSNKSETENDKSEIGLNSL